MWNERFCQNTLLSSSGFEIRLQLEWPVGQDGFAGKAAIRPGLFPVLTSPAACGAEAVPHSTIEAAEAEEALTAGRRGQQALDNWYASRQYRQGGGSWTGMADSHTSGGPDAAAGSSPAAPGSWIEEET